MPFQVFDKNDEPAGETIPALVCDIPPNQPNVRIVRERGDDCAARMTCMWDVIAPTRSPHSYKRV